MDRNEHNDSPRHSRLPVLTGALLVLLALGALEWFLLLRPKGEERLMLAAFSDALRLLPRMADSEVDRRDLYHAAMQGMARGLGDPYSRYLTPEELRAVDVQTTGQFSGIGVVVAVRESLPVVTEVIPDSPAKRAGFQKGDVLLAVDGRPLKGMPLADVADLLRGEPGSQVRVRLRRAGDGSEVELSLTRQVIRIPHVYWEMLRDGIGLLRIKGFDSRTSADVAGALEAMKAEGLRGLLVDLRGNPGGVVDEAVRVCDMFIEDGVILHQRSRHAAFQSTERARPGALVAQDVPIVVLVDEGTASAAEVLAGALQAHGRATVVGTRTLGKGAVNRVIELPDGSGFSVVVAHYVLPDGRSVDGLGLEPDVEVSTAQPSPGGGPARAGRELLERAIEVLRGKIGAAAADAEGGR